MKKYLIVMPLLLIFLTSSVSFGQCSKELLKKACCSWETCLKSEHPAIVKSALIHVMWLYTHYPANDFSKISNQLDFLATNGATEEIKMISGLVKKYVTNQIDLSWMMDFEYEQIHIYFSMVSASINQNLVLK